jgi:hypothetical protein
LRAPSTRIATRPHRDPPARIATRLPASRPAEHPTKHPATCIALEGESARWHEGDRAARSIPMAATLSIPENVVSEVLGEETVLLNLDSGVYFSLSETGTRIWQLLRDLGQADRIADAMAEEYDAPRDRLQADVEDLIQKLMDRGLVRAEDSRP